MNIAGVVIHARPDKITAVQHEILALPGVEIHGTKQDGRMVVTVEDDGYKETSDTVLSLHQIKDVLSATLVYQHNEELPDEITIST
jgi:nitrate reductase NapD